MSDLKSTLIVVSALGSGLVGGIFFAFSSFIMKALARVPPAQGIAVMQSINLTVLNTWFFAVFFGTGACCLALGISSLFRWGKPAAGYLLAGSLLYLIGTIIVTIACNVPLKRRARRRRPIECRRWSRLDRLSQEVDRLESPADGSGPGRSSFVYRWTLSRWFTVRFCSSQSVVAGDVHNIAA
jgi:uncharacterized membrane protein